jgi:hypothetical protein
MRRTRVTRLKILIASMHVRGEQDGAQAEGIATRNVCVSLIPDEQHIVTGQTGASEGVGKELRRGLARACVNRRDD